jgi:two-component system sensor histidine kinase YesM
MPFSRIRQRYRDLPLARKMNVLIAVSVVVPLLLLVTLYTGITRGLTIDGAIESEVRNLDYIAGNLESLYEYTDALTRIVVTDTYLQQVASSPIPDDESTRFDDLFRVRIILDRVVQRQSTVRSAYVSLYDGRVFGSAQIDGARLKEHESELAELRTMFSEANPGPVLLPTRPTRFEIDHDVVQSLGLARRFISVESGAVVGTIVLNVGQDSMRDSLSGGEAGTRFPTLLLDEVGRILAASLPFAADSVFEDVVGPTRLADRGTDARVVLFADVPHVVIDRPLPDASWSLVRLAPLSDIVGPTRYVNLIVLGIGLVCLVIAVTLSIPITSPLTHRVRDLIEAMSLAGQGDLEVRVEVDARDEIGQVSDYFNKMVGQISGLMSEVYEEQSDKRRFELMALQAQIQPHFLYNALDGVCALSQMGRSEDAYTMAKALSLFYRGALSRGRNVITLGEELEIVEQYLTIQSMRYPGRFTYSIDVPEELRTRPTLKLLLQPLVENSIYHGFRGTDIDGHIRIRAKECGGEYLIVVEDNGKGGEEQEASGFGLASVRDRVKLYFGATADVTFCGDPGNVSVSVRLPSPRNDDG